MMVQTNYGSQVVTFIYLNSIYFYSSFMFTEILSITYQDFPYTPSRILPPPAMMYNLPRYQHPLPEWFIC